MSATIDLSFAQRPFTAMPDALALKLRYFGVTKVTTHYNPLDGYCIMGCADGRARIFRTPAQVHQFCLGRQRTTVPTDAR